MFEFFVVIALCGLALLLRRYFYKIDKQNRARLKEIEDKFIEELKKMNARFYIGFKGMDEPELGPMTKNQIKQALVFSIENCHKTIYHILYGILKAIDESEGDPKELSRIIKNGMLQNKLENKILIDMFEAFDFYDLTGDRFNLRNLMKEIAMKQVEKESKNKK